MNADPDFEAARLTEIRGMAADGALQALSREWLLQATNHGYSYHFDVLGRPIIQFPQDIVALNEVIWAVRPDVVIETGIARGGSVVNTAAQLALLDLSESPTGGDEFRLSPRRRVLSVDIDIRPPNRAALESHFLAPWFQLIEGSSVDSEVVADVTSRIPPGSVVMVLLDSNHTHDHVLAELQAYAPLVSAGSYCIVYDTIIEQLPVGHFSERPWEVGDNPATAIREFLNGRADFVVDESISQKLLISVAPGGYLRRVT